MAAEEGRTVTAIRNRVPHRRSRAIMVAVAAAAFGAALLASATVAASGASAASATRALASGGIWGKAKRVPDLLLNTGNAETDSVSCGSAGNCGAGGFYTDTSGHFQAFVVNEVNGVWGKALKVAGALNTAGQARVASVSCGSAGNCTAGGQYKNGPGHFHYQGFVVSEVNGVWGKAREVPGLAALNVGGDAEMHALSCASAGNCSAAGDYSNASGQTKAFVVSQKNGSWGTAIEIPGTAALSAGGNIAPDQVSCGSAGNCAAGGSYNNTGNDPSQAFRSARRTASGAPRRRCPAPPPSTRADPPKPTRCHAPRRAIAAPAGSTPTRPASFRRLS